MLTLTLAEFTHFNFSMPILAYMKHYNCYGFTIISTPSTTAGINYGAYVLHTNPFQSAELNIKYLFILILMFSVLISIQNYVH